MKIRLLMLGKTRRPELCGILDDYVKRIGRSSKIEVTEVRDGDAALKKLKANRGAETVLLDAGGNTMDSEDFARWIRERRDRGMKELAFVCGDADGFPKAVRELVKEKISLSEMTYSHELARVMLAEQIYRALAILAGSAYPK